MIKNSREICIIAHSYFPHMDPRVNRQVWTLIENGFSVDIICLKKPDDSLFEVKDSINIFRVPVKYKRGNLIFRIFNVLHFFILAYLKLNKLARSNKYYAIHIHTHLTFLVFIGSYQKLKKIPIILDLHDLVPESFKGRYPNSFIKYLYILAYLEEYISCRFADYIIVVNEEIRNILIKRKINPTKLNIIMNLADNRYFHEIPLDRSKIDIGMELLYYGSLSGYNGLDDAIVGLNQIINHYPNITLLILGEGHHQQYLRELVKKLQLEKNVSILDPVRPEKIPTLVKEKTVGILPRKDNIKTKSAIATKLLEYAAMGLPVICSRIPILEHYFNNDMVEFIEPGNPSDFARALKNLHDDTNRRIELSKNILNFNKIYNWENEKGKLLGIYQRIQNS